MRRRAVGMIVGAGAAALALGGYLVADAHDIVPGVLTLSDSPAPTAPPTMEPRGALVPTISLTGSGAVVSADQVKELWQPVQDEATSGQWKTWGIVIDAESGQVLLDAASATPHAPASTTKVLSAVTALTHLDESARLATGTSLMGTDLYLWGQGDLFLARGNGDPDAINGRAGVADLAAATATSLSERGISHVTLYWKHSIFTGAPRLAAWDDQQVSNYEGPVGAFAIDTGRVGPGEYAFLEDPGRDVALEFAANLRNAGIEAVVTAELDVPSIAEEIARVESATIGQQVRWMLHHSDNTSADQYCRLAAQAAGNDPSFAGASKTVMATLTSLGVDITGMRVDDCSGLTLDNRISGRTLAQTIQATMVSDSPTLRDLVRSLPWGGVDGTMGERFESGPAAANVQAKTGSLPSVASLAGVVTTAGGRTLVFAIGNDEVPDGAAYWTRWELDEFIEGLASL